MPRKTIAQLVGVAIALALVSYWIGQQSYSWLPPQASAESLMVDNLFSFLTTVGAFIFLGVSGTLVYSALFQRAAKYDMGDGPPIEGNVTLEIVWTAIPFVLVMWVALYSFQIYDRMGILGPMEHNHSAMAMAGPMTSAMESGSSPAIAEPDPAGSAIAEGAPALPDNPPIDVYARQWAWEFRYTGDGADHRGPIVSTELHLPTQQRARLMLHSEDVIHGFYIPAFRVKQDIIPNEATLFEFTPIREGRYRLRDSLYSGTYFAAMQTDVVVQSPEDYQAWLAAAAATDPTPGRNPAYEEYSRRMAQANTPGWQTVPPAPPPLVNDPVNTPVLADPQL